MVRRLIVTLGIASLASAACTSSGSPAPARSSGTQPSSPAAQVAGEYHPAIDPANFTTTIDNAYMPLVPGTTWIYQGLGGSAGERDEVTVSSKTKVIEGVTCVVVNDVIKEGGQLIEKTDDWFAQDKQGNVWYFGEATATYKNGKVDSTEGSWESGLDGAEPGIVMPAQPKAPQSFRQEYYPGHAEDQFWIVDTTESIKVAAGSYRNVVRTLEWSRIEPDIIDTKYYAPGVGSVMERSVAGEHENFELVRVSEP
jgi:hypothetical protein